MGIERLRLFTGIPNYEKETGIPNYEKEEGLLAQVLQKSVLENAVPFIASREISPSANGALRTQCRSQDRP
jgi:hypothetical protein